GRAVYGDQPIGWPVAGSLETVGEMQRDDFVDHMAAFYRTGNTVLSVAGNIEHAQVVDWASRYFDHLPAGDAPEATSSQWGLPEEHMQIAERALEQTNLALSMQAIARRDPDRYALDLMNTALGRGMSSRLFKEVRERRGL